MPSSPAGFSSVKLPAALVQQVEAYWAEQLK